jgi:anti-sigma factor RsiW
MNSDMQLKVQAYLDNELTPGEARRIATLLSTDQVARDLYTELKETKEIVGKNEPAPRLQESRDFYWSKIQRELEKAERVELPAAATTPWWGRLLVPVAGAVALFAILLSVSDPGNVSPPTMTASQSPSDSGLPIHRGEIVSPGMSAITFRSEAEGITVVWVSADASPQRSDLLDWLE